VQVLSVRQDLPLRPRYFIITYRGEKDSDKPTVMLIFMGLGLSVFH
jgi:hypothetical protein